MLGVPSAKFTCDLDLLKAETLRILLRLLLQVSQVDPLNLYTTPAVNGIDAELFQPCLTFYSQLADTEYQVDESAPMISLSNTEQIARECQEIALKLLN